jgi:hypothetical protein
MVGGTKERDICGGRIRQVRISCGKAIEKAGEAESSNLSTKTEQKFDMRMYVTQAGVVEAKD